MVHRVQSSEISPLRFHCVILIKIILQLKNTQFQSSKLLPGNYIDIEGTTLISNFDNKSLKKFALKSTTTRQCYNSKTVQSNSYLTSPSINNGTTSDQFINTTYEVDAPSVYN